MHSTEKTISINQGKVITEEFGATGIMIVNSSSQSLKYMSSNLNGSFDAE